MTEHVNSLGQPIGFSVAGWQARPWPARSVMQGRFCRLEPLDPGRHCASLFEAFQLDREGRNWTYLPVGPFATLPDFRAWAEPVSVGDDPIFFTVVDAKTERPVGYASYLRIDAKSGVIEVGSINYTPLLQRTPAATEAMYLMMRNVFDTLGYRRYEWKCNSLNAPSRAAAVRLGFTFEGIFRQAWVVKGRNRDTAWYSILDSEWPAQKAAFERWLAPANFDANGNQRESLAALTKMRSP
ncbi:MAG: GNAT family N-acetyltransferase [Proteobacteria bacterium]|nr:GNAT family N-acetyltransferase [Pseudomonadota bacterium]